MVARADAAGLDAALVRRICDRHYGVGSDGILVVDPDSTPGTDGAAFALAIWNPDGSRAGKSGNGLRIAARYLFDRGRVGEERFWIRPDAGAVACEVRAGGRSVFVEMGRASFASAAIPVAGPAREVVDEEIEIGDERLRFTGVTVGNPHCVVFVDRTEPELARAFGPRLERHALFPERTNVQFTQVVGRNRLRLEIWERGAGYTLASGSSASAAAAAAVRLGRIDPGAIAVEMPGGELEIDVDADFAVTMVGPVARVASGFVAPEVWSTC